MTVHVHLRPILSVENEMRKYLRYPVSLWKAFAFHYLVSYIDGSSNVWFGDLWSILMHIDVHDL